MLPHSTRLRSERGATDPILVIAAIAVSLILLVGGSFAVAGMSTNAHKQNAYQDLVHVATAETAAAGDGTGFLNWAVTADGVVTGDKDADGNTLDKKKVGFTTTDGVAMKAVANAQAWIAGALAANGTQYWMCSGSSKVYEGAPPSGRCDPGLTLPELVSAKPLAPLARGVGVSLAGALSTTTSVDGVGSAAGFSNVGTLVKAPNGSFIVGEGPKTIRTVTEAGAVSTVTVAAASRTATVTADGAGNLYIADSTARNIRKVAPDGTSSVYAGSGTSGYKDGAANVAQFTAFYSIAAAPDGTLYVADSSKSIRRVSTTGQVTTYAGTLGSGGVSSGPTGQMTTSFQSVYGMQVDASGVLYTTDAATYRVMKVAPTTVSVVAGSASRGKTNGAAASAQFMFPTALTIADDGTMYVSDPDALRVISGGQVTSIPYAGITIDGTNPRDLSGLALDSTGAVVAADPFSNRIIRIGV